MNFGEILDKWEHGSQSSARRKNENGAMESWLKDNEVMDKDRSDGNTGGQAGERRRRLLQKKPDDILDIHGLTKEEANISLDVFFNNAKDREYQKLRIIHGKGNHSPGEVILKRVVLMFIEQCPFAGESGYEKSANGGTGATWVLLK